MISIIIPTFNRADLLPETLHSIQNQSDGDWECILVDDGSSDDTCLVLNDFAAKDPRFHVYHRKEFSDRKGANACRNKGIQKAKGHYLLFFDSDDLMQPDCISEHKKGIEKSAADVHILPSVYFDETVEIPILKGDVFSKDVIEKFFRKEIVWLTHNPAVKKEFLTKHQIEFDENLQAAQDWDFFMRILLAQPKLEISDYIGVKMRLHDNTISKNSEGKALKHFHYYQARKGIYHQYFSEIQRDKLKNYYTSYAENMLRELIKMQKMDWAREIIINESFGHKRIANLFYLKLYASTKKGLSKIAL